MWHGPFGGAIAASSSDARAHTHAHTHTHTRTHTRTHTHTHTYTGVGSQPGPHAMLVQVRFEDIVSSPIEQLTSLYDWLGLESGEADLVRARIS